MATTYNFQNPTVRAKASAKAAVAARPKSYNSKSKRIEQAKVEICKDLLLKEGYADAIRPHMPQITKAMIQSASKPTSSGTADRRLIFQAVGLIGKDASISELPTMAQVLEKIFANANPNEFDD